MEGLESERMRMMKNGDAKHVLFWIQKVAKFVQCVVLQNNDNV
jgi:hypothetical protein